MKKGDLPHIPWYVFPIAVIVYPIWIIRNIFKGKYDDPKKEPKGHGGLNLPWWYMPLMMVAMPFILLREWIKGNFKKGDPHDISGEPDIPGGDRP